MDKKHKAKLITLLVRLISGIVGFINGIWVVFTGASYFKELSPYYYLADLFPKNYRNQFLDSFESSFVFFLAPFSGAVMGAIIGWVISCFFQRETNSAEIVAGAIAGGIAGFLSLAVLFMNIYAS